jgi:uncharacterized protein (TIGR02145 family)
MNPISHSLLIIGLSLFLTSYCHAQVKIDLAGGLTIQDSGDPNPAPGTIRWTGTDVEGWNGIIWVSLTDGILGSVTDIGGNVYKTLKLGNNTWMIENLRTRFFNDATSIGDIISTTGWAAATFAARCRYNNSNANINPYGYLYNGYAAEDDRLCPTGWHVSTVADWEDLLSFWNGASVAAGSLKESGTTHWAAPNSGATNESGFTALPGGNRKPDGSYVNLTQYGNYWAIDLISLPLKDYNFEYNNIDVTQLTLTQKQWGLSVRCVKD